MIKTLELLDKMCELYWDGCDTAAGEKREELETAIRKLEQERDCYSSIVDNQIATIQELQQQRAELEEAKQNFLDCHADYQSIGKELAKTSRELEAVKRERDDLIGRPVPLTEWQMMEQELSDLRAKHEALVQKINALEPVAWMVHSGEIWNTPRCPYKSEVGAPLYDLKGIKDERN